MCETSHFEEQHWLPSALRYQIPASTPIKFNRKSLNAAQTEANGRQSRHGEADSVSTDIMCGFSVNKLSPGVLHHSVSVFRCSFSPQVLWIYSCISELN